MPYRLRPDLRLVTSDAAAPATFLEDPATHRRFRVQPRELAIVRGLLTGLDAPALTRALAEAGVPATPAQYLSSFARAHLAEPAPEDLATAVRRDLEARQWSRLHRTVVDAAATIPYYQRVLAEAGVEPAALTGLDDFAARVPLLTRAGYRAAFPDQLLPRGRSYLDLLADPSFRVTSSSGTTDERIQVIQSQADLARAFNAAYLHSNLFEKRHAIFGPPQCMALSCFKDVPSFDERYFGYALLLASADVMGQRPEAAAALLAELTTTAIDVVVANPYYLAFTAHQARRVGAPLPAIRTLYASYDYTQVTTRRFLEDTFGVACGDLYGMTEGGYQLMRSCAHGGIHLAEDLFHFELVPEAASSRLVFSTLTSELVPMIRYQTTDLFQPADGLPCRCGSPLRRVGGFDGRVQDRVALGAGHAYGAVDRAIGAIDGVVMYQLEPGRDRLGFGYLGDAAPDRVASLVAQRLEPLVGAPVAVTARRVSAIGLGRSGKLPAVLRVA